MEKWNLIVDVALCHNCNNCALAAKDENAGNAFPGYSAPHAAQGPGVLGIRRHVRGTGHQVDVAYQPVMCNHCDDAPCIKAGKGAVYKRADGIVIIDPVKAKGRRDLVASCPYEAIVWNEEEQLPQNWYFDAHLLDAGWTEPRCQSVCPTRAIEAAKTDDAAMTRRATREGLRVRQPELGTRPRVYYRNLHRMDGLLVAGSFIMNGSRGIECVSGVEVMLTGPDMPPLRAVSDTFGDFRIDGLRPGGKQLRLTATHAQYQAWSTSLVMGEQSVALGNVTLTLA